MSLPLLSKFILLYHLVGLYAFMGLSAPLPVKFNCIQESSAKVAQKFTRPLDFDLQSKNALREFWHYSYFRQCLFDHGLDTHGKKLPISTISGNTYHNPQAGLTLTASNLAIQSDNRLNVDYDDRLLLSHLSLNHQSVDLAVYTNNDDLKYATQSTQILHFPGVNDPIIAATISGQNAFLTDSTGRTGLLFFSPSQIPRIIYGFGLDPEFFQLLTIH